MLHLILLYTVIVLLCTFILYQRHYITELLGANLTLLERYRSASRRCEELANQVSKKV